MRKCGCERKFQQGVDYVSCGSDLHFHQKQVSGYDEALIVVVG